VSSTLFQSPSRAGIAATRHELTFLNVFRLVQALVYIGLAYTPSKLGWPLLGAAGFARGVTSLYLIFALLALLFNRRSMAYPP
jgi:hypothetical protein